MISVVIPIFNEEENINKLSQSITKALSDIDYEVLFIKRFIFFTKIKT